MDLPEKMRALIDAVRGRTKANPDNTNLKPLEQRRRGYQLYAQEATAMGDDVMSYEDWIKSQE